jgi:RimJ/RimL family protein N-acetyltransferase
MRDLANWQPCPKPSITPIQGHHTRLEPIIDDQHFEGLWHAYAADQNGAIWAYLPYGPFAGKDEFLEFARTTYLGEDPLFHVLIDIRSGNPLGVLSLMRINAEHGVIEVGHICYAPAAQRTIMATEAIYLLARLVFDELGYRRFEWKCNAANEASCRAAKRLGFTFEGTFRQALVIKKKNRDTAWFSMLDHEWPKQKSAFEAWLNDDNFDQNGKQKKSLSALKQ